MNASDEQLKNDLGLIKLGDRLSLRSFCENQHGKTGACSKAEIDSRKKRLLEELAKKRNKKQHTAQSAQKGKTVVTKSTRKVELAWLHCPKGSESFKLVKMKEGGGIRLVDILKSANKTEIIKIARELFFSDGKWLYIDYFKLSKVRLYLSTMINEEHDDDIDSDNNSEISDSVLEHSVLDDEPVPVVSDEQENAAPHLLNTDDSLIGTSKEREQLKNLIDKAYEESLLADQNKSLQTLRKGIPRPVDIHQTDDSLDELREVRTGRLSEEPDVSDPHYIVSVRHLSLGVVTRLFSLTDMMFSVYDWIGSLHKSPKYFQLCNYSGGCLSPQESVKIADRCMLVMVESEYPVPFSPDEELIPKGFGPLSSSPPGNAIVIDPIPEKCPTTIMVDDESDIEGHCDNSM
ncbi:uncharacterized protein LOC114532163 [Dendronephthya gigantea]|uniref:uncharacterized protein LOC114532163 n=1 Tax=Dendronephthya gigantea TaxID=151771 RepID=UPI0010692009|nr:uncharacterized protein LOC114532163 [Dendronephthya gigantea]